MTGYGFTGPMTARGTVFADKGAAPVVSSDDGATTYRWSYTYGASTLALLVASLFGSR